MENKIRRSFCLTGFLFLLFAAFTCVIAFVDVQPIGPNQTSVGLSSLNQFVFERIGVNLAWYLITDLLGLVALLFAFAFAVLGLIQLIQRKSLLKVDIQLLLLGAFYIAVIAFYLFFERVAINYRPVILGSCPEASYPSSHTMIVLCIMSTAMQEFRRLLFRNRPLRRILNGISVSIISVTIIGRLLSGVHWFTDILGGLLLSAALILLYSSTVQYILLKFPHN